MEEVDEFDIFNFTNDTAEELFESPTLSLQISLTVLYSIIFIAGILGNTSTCLVIGRNRSMHTATNFYLFSLAVSDLILLICGLPFEVHKLWDPYTYPLNSGMCITFGLASETSANATVLTITAFTMERYIAICKPFMSRTMSKLSRAVRLIILIWIGAFCAAIPQALQFGIVSSSYGNGQTMSVCTVIGQGVHLLFIVSSFAFFVAPMSVIIILYILIGVKLRTSYAMNPKAQLSLDQTNNDRNAFNQRYRNGSSQRRVIRMLVVVALSFFVCWAPFHVQRLLAIYGKSLEKPSYEFYTVYIILTYLSGVLYYLSTAINPILYNIMSNKFRNAFKVTFRAWFGRKAGPGLGRTYSALLASRQRRTHSNALANPPLQSPNDRRLRRLSTATTQLYEAPPRAQRYNEQNISLLSGMNVHWARVWRLRYVEPYSARPQSISNSSLREVDEELTGEELATYMYQVNCDIGGLT